MSERERVARWLYEWRHHRPWDETDGDHRGRELCLEQADELLALLGERQEPVGSEWWCPECKEIVSPMEVTFQERHDLCGCAVRVAPKPSVEREFVEEVSRGPYPDSDQADLLSTIVSRARAILAAQEVSDE